MVEAYQRRSALAHFGLNALASQKADGAGVTLGESAHRAIINIRGDAKDGAFTAAVKSATGCDLPLAANTVAMAGDVRILWLGPDEWLVIDEAGNDPLADCAGVAALHSAVGISHRNIAIAVTGKAAAATINAGCPQDLSLDAFPVGACSRTILGKTEIVLLRTAQDAFRVECWRSFSDYVFTFLSEAARDAAA